MSLICICSYVKELISLDKRKYQEDNKININQYNTTRMAEQGSTRTNYSSLLLQKKGNQLLDLHQRTDPKKPIERKYNSVANNKNGGNWERINGHSRGRGEDDQNTTNRMEDDLAHLRRQIDTLETYDHPDLKLRYESEAFVLHKRRTTHFRGFEHKDQNTTIPSKQDRSIILDNFINRKKPNTKNSLKIKKFLNTFIAKSLDQVKINHFLQFISNKHKIPFEIINKTPKLTIGYKQADLRKISKYQISINNLPPLGITFDTETKTPELTDDTEVKPLVDTFDILNEEVDCFEQRPQFQGYVLPEQDVLGSFADQKRQIFKISRNITRNKLEKESSLKRLAYHSVREVEKRYMRCIRNQNDYINRAKKLHRECLVYWRKREKQLIQLKKKKEKLETELKKRDEEEQQARKQQKRLQYIMYQSGLYSHFMATKLGVQDHKKQLDNLGPIGNKPLDIDEEAAMLSVNQIINSKMENLEKFDKKKDEKLDLSSVDQGKLELVGTPSSFHGILKEYQIKGLRWLNHLFEQGINGILADEMGLGKTIQAIALLSHISQNKGIWGPFLVVAPNSTLYNWQQQFKKFCPSLKVLPYWGNIKQRKTIRKFFSAKKFNQRADSPFHVVITSYQLTVTDQKTFKRLKWQFMILDEAQAIKNILSQRWNTLKEFQSRNRLLLTGTPIQNNMAELWALLNFVMPDLFDSHELFNEWFSKDIEAHSQDQKQLDQIKIQRLHAILKPFMLRRIKKDVEHEIGKKYQHQILCEMTKRQKLLYQSIKEKLNVKELFKMFESKAKVQNLMNLVMQLRKVCNHPELFERRPARSPFSFQQLYYYTGSIPIRAGQIKLLSYNAKNPIAYTFPKLIYDELLRFTEKRQNMSKRLVNIYEVANQLNNPTFSSLHMTNFSNTEIKLCFEQDTLVTALLLLHWWKRGNHSSTFSTSEKLHINTDLYQQIDYRFKLSLFNEIRSMQQVYMPNATAPLIEPIITSRSFYEDYELLNNNKFQKFIFEGKYQNSFKNYFNEEFPGITHNCKSLTYIQVIDFGNLIADSSKLKELDRILKQKKRNGDKVLIFCQMTKMIDILQDFMNLRKYTFFRLDGASNIADRRDMVNDFQKPQSKIFVFLLSTRAGGLGVTLTAANTVIFYDNDWNPTMDAQATDRAHRIGQSRDVNVYQLVTKGTIEQRIVKRAQQKKTVQSTVYQGASFNFFKKDMIIELMVDQFHPEGAAIEEKNDKGERGKKDAQQANRKKGGKLRGKEEKDDKRDMPQKLQEMMQNIQKIEMGQ